MESGGGGGKSGHGGSSWGGSWELGNWTSAAVAANFPACYNAQGLEIAASASASASRSAFPDRAGVPLEGGDHAAEISQCAHRSFRSHHLTCLKLGKRHYYEEERLCGGASAAAGKREKAAAAAAAAGTPFPRCQVEGCDKSLVDAKDYHKRHKVCDVHAKAPKVIVLGAEQRFCQQCSRLAASHILSLNWANHLLLRFSAVSVLGFCFFFFFFYSFASFGQFFLLLPLLFFFAFFVVVCEEREKVCPCPSSALPFWKEKRGGLRCGKEEVSSSQVVCSP